MLLYNKNIDINHKFRSPGAMDKELIKELFAKKNVLAINFREEIFV
jgi:hypothetical protein